MNILSNLNRLELPFHQQRLQFFCREVGTKHVVISSADVACLFAHNDCQSVCLFADAFCSTMSKSELLWNV